MYSPPCASGNNGEQCFAGGATPLVSLDQAMDFSEPIVFPMHDVGMQEGVQFCNATGDLQPSRNVSIDKCSKGGKRKVAGEGSSSMHSQEETDVMSQREVGAERGNENTSDGDTNREDYVHVRAKRGQATNSHSLAERFRREKINERMKLLQDLVPGCNKITGKAMMLDEIINYVQSLQRQVEFLSMKLSAISPELNCDLDHLPLKDILCSQDACSAFLGSSSRLNNVHPNLYRVSQQGFSRRDPFSSFPNPADAHMARTHQFAALPQRAVLWDDELRSIAPVAFMNSDAATSSLENSDAMKVE